MYFVSFHSPTARRINEVVSAKLLFFAAIFTTNDVFAFCDAYNDETCVILHDKPGLPALSCLLECFPRWQNLLAS